MPSVTITITDTPTGGVALHTEFTPAAGQPCSPAQAAALDIINRIRHEYKLAHKLPANVPPVAFRVGGIDIDAVHRTHDNVIDPLKFPELES